MQRSNLIDVNKDFIVQKYANGIKLIKPKKNTYQAEKTVANLFNLPLNVIFLNPDSAIQSLNESNAATLGCSSTTKALGNTILSVYKNNPAHFSINHDKEILTRSRFIIKEESCERIDDISFQAITAKLPWYNDNNKIIGVIGFSIPIGLQLPNMESGLFAFVKLTSLFSSLACASSILPGQIINDIYLSRREAECVQHLMHGKTVKMIALSLNLSPRTVEGYLENVKAKFQVNSKADLINKIINNQPF